MIDELPIHCAASASGAWWPHWAVRGHLSWRPSHRDRDQHCTDDIKDRETPLQRSKLGEDIGLSGCLRPFLCGMLWLDLYSGCSYVRTVALHMDAKMSEHVIYLLALLRSCTLDQLASL